MTREQEIRDELILQLYGAGMSVALQLKFILKQTKREGRDYSEKELLDQLHFLKGQGLVSFEQDATGVQRFRITAAGCLFKESNG
jgi:hypothetical protein